MPSRRSEPPTRRRTTEQNLGAMKTDVANQIILGPRNSSAPRGPPVRRRRIDRIMRRTPGRVGYDEASLTACNPSCTSVERAREGLGRSATRRQVRPARTYLDDLEQRLWPRGHRPEGLARCC